MTPQAKKYIEEMADNHADEEVAFGRCGFDDIAEDFCKGAQAMHDYYVANGVGEFDFSKIDYHGCLTGDCHHDKQIDCFRAIAEEQHSQDVAALSALQAENEKLEAQIAEYESDKYCAGNCR